MAALAAMSEHELQNGKADHDDDDDEEVPVFVSPGEPGVMAINFISAMYVAALKLGDSYKTSL